MNNILIIVLFLLTYHEEIRLGFLFRGSPYACISLTRADQEVDVVDVSLLYQEEEEGGKREKSRRPALRLGPQGRLVRAYGAQTLYPPIQKSAQDRRWPFHTLVPCIPSSFAGRKTAKV